MEISFAIGAGMGCVYLKLFCKWSRTSPFHSWSGDGILYQESHKAHTNDLEKCPTKEYYCQWC